MEEGGMERNFIDWIQEKGWYLLNGSCKGDWEGEFTYVGVRESIVIDCYYERKYNK